MRYKLYTYVSDFTGNRTVPSMDNTIIVRVTPLASPPLLYCTVLVPYTSSTYYLLLPTTVPTTRLLPTVLYYLLPTAYYLLHTKYYLLLYLIPTTCYLLPTTIPAIPTYYLLYLLPTTCYLLHSVLLYLLPPTYYLLPTTF